MEPDLELPRAHLSCRARGVSECVYHAKSKIDIVIWLKKTGST